jgi:hypothetical protein
MNMRDRLADDYLRRVERHIDHGLDEPRPGGFDIMRDLKEDLDVEQDKILGEQNKDEFWKSSSEMTRDRPDIMMGPMVIEQVFITSDLYQEMADANDVATAERSAILKVDTPTVLADGTPCTEHYFSAKITYHIDMAMFLGSIGVPQMYVDEAAAYMAECSTQVSAYIERNGPNELLDKWLPGKPSDLDFELKWEVVSVTYVPFARVDVVLKVTERWLTPSAS